MKDVTRYFCDDIVHLSDQLAVLPGQHRLDLMGVTFINKPPLLINFPGTSQGSLCCILEAFSLSGASALFVLMCWIRCLVLYWCVTGVSGAFAAGRLRRPNSTSHSDKLLGQLTCHEPYANLKTVLHPAELNLLSTHCKLAQTMGPQQESATH